MHPSYGSTILATTTDGSSHGAFCMKPSPVPVQKPKYGWRHQFYQHATRDLHTMAEGAIIPCKSAAMRCPTEITQPPDIWAPEVLDRDACREDLCKPCSKYRRRLGVSKPMKLAAVIPLPTAGPPKRSALLRVGNVQELEEGQLQELFGSHEKSCWGAALASRMLCPSDRLPCALSLGLRGTSEGGCWAYPCIWNEMAVDKSG